MVKTMSTEALAHKMLARAEQSNMRTTMKICDFLMDLAKRPEIGEDFLVRAIFDQMSGSGSSNLQVNGSHKALLTELNLLLKVCQQFTVHTTAYQEDESEARSKTLCWYHVLEVVLPSFLH